MRNFSFAITRERHSFKLGLYFIESFLCLKKVRLLPAHTMDAACEATSARAGNQSCDNVNASINKPTEEKFVWNETW